MDGTIHWRLVRDFCNLVRQRRTLKPSALEPVMDHRQCVKFAISVENHTCSGVGNHGAAVCHRWIWYANKDELVADTEVIDEGSSVNLLPQELWRSRGQEVTLSSPGHRQLLTHLQYLRSLSGIMQGDKRSFRHSWMNRWKMAALHSRCTQLAHPRRIKNAPTPVFYGACVSIVLTRMEVVGRAITTETLNDPVARLSVQHLFKRVFFGSFSLSPFLCDPDAQSWRTKQRNSEKLVVGYIWSEKKNTYTLSLESRQAIRYIRNQRLDRGSIVIMHTIMYSEYGR